MRTPEIPHLVLYILANRVHPQTLIDMAILMMSTKRYENRKSAADALFRWLPDLEKDKLIEKNIANLVGGVAFYTITPKGRQVVEGSIDKLPRAFEVSSEVDLEILLPNLCLPLQSSTDREEMGG